MFLILDSDHLAYRASASCEPTKLKPFLESKEDAIIRVDGMMEQILETFNYPDYSSYIGGQGNWRYAIYPDYKANRKNTPKPTWLEDVRERLITHWKAEIVNDIEVDDRCGIELSLHSNAVCVSLDKDLLTISGSHYNFVKKQLVHIDELTAKRNFYKQVITGDASDNIPAFDGKFRHAIPKFVEPMLAPIDSMTEEQDMYKHALSIHEQYGSSVANMSRNAQCLFIQTEENVFWKSPLGPKDVKNPLL